MQQRYMEPNNARFLQNDPIDSLGHIERGNPVHGFNRKTYANNNPYKYTDPDGEWAMQAIGAIVGGFTAYSAVKNNNNLTTMQKTMKVLTGAAVGGLTAHVTGAKLLKNIAQGAKAALNSSGKVFAQKVAVGGLTGGIAAGSTEIVGELASSGTMPKADKVITSAVQGAIVGGMATAAGPALLGETIVGEGVGAATAVGLENAINN
jgi:hypothetical protein